MGMARIMAFSLTLVATTFGTPDKSIGMPVLTDYSLGLTQEELLARGAEQCVQGDSESLCEEIGFGEEKWGGQFEIKEGKLRAIELKGGLDRKFLEAGLKGFRDSGFALVYAESGNEHIDLLALESEDEKGSSEKALSDFMTKVAGDNTAGISYIYCDKKTVGSFLKEKKDEFFGSSHKGEQDGLLCINSEGVHVILSDKNALQNHLAFERARTAKEKIRFEAYKDSHPEKYEPADPSRERDKTFDSVDLERNIAIDED